MKDYSCPTGPTFLDGVLLVASAIPDAGLVYRGSTCVEERIRQTLYPHAGDDCLNASTRDGRLVLTMDPYTVAVMGTEDRVADAVEHLASRDDIRLVLLASLSRYTLTGEKLDPLARALDARTPGVTVQALSTRLLNRDHHDAFRAFYDGLAKRLVAEGTDASAPGTVGILGYPRLRDGGDSRGDLEELGRLVEALGLTCAGAILDGRPSTAFPAVAKAGTLVAFPDAECAAATLSAATGAGVVSGTLPVALGDTGSWIRGIAEKTGSEGHVETIVNEELRRVVPLLDRFVHHGLLGRRAIVAATAEWLPSLVRCLQEDLGVVVCAAVARTRHHDLEESWQAPADLHLDTGTAGLNDLVDDARGGGGLDLIIGSNWEFNALQREHRSVPFVEFGYPQRRVSFLRPAPHLGYTGVLTWAERLMWVLSGG